MKTGHALRRLSTGVRAGALVAAGLGIANAVAGSGCQIVGGYKSFQGHPCNVLPASKPDPQNVATLVLSKQPDGTCFWIDQTEVTVEQYGRFLANGSSAVTWDSACAWKLPPSNPAGDASDPCSASTSGESEPFRTTKPIRCVDWCDARAFCRWVGMDLCSGVAADGIVTPQDLPDQWGTACSADGLPYVNGSTPVDGACNVGFSPGQCLSIIKQYSCAPADVGFFSQCASPSGAVDMIGNVAEWVLQCGYATDGGPGGANSLCQDRGGSYAGSLADTTCYSVDSHARATRDRGIGLRCCADLTQDESHRVQSATGP